ncbi:hypothetical protein [Blastococcus sp. TF02-8]|uniref:hypothetical protein n=1 Tax=Blastococcus sp. TF02-8 TaxID=2250574 RepID=UPI0011BD4B76|nr:hypothetical protein [Blastococcus sp. TF02-8]
MEAWKRVGRLLQRNSEELLAYLDGIALEGDPVDGEKERSEVERLLLNFASAASARVDHSRNAFDKESPDFQERYAPLKDTLGESTEHLLAWGIRNYILHVGLPPLNWVGYLEVRPPLGLVTVLDFHVDREALRRVDFFKGGSKKKALDAQEPMIRLAPLVKAYAEAAKALDAEVVELFEQLHAEELDEDFAMWREVQAAWKEAGLGAWVGATED